MVDEVRRAGEEPAGSAVARPRLTTLGQAKLVCEGRDVAIPNRKSLALLAYLACTTHGSASRECLAGLLWSESSESKARASLRQAVGDLRSALNACDASLFAADRLNVHLRLLPLETDLRELRGSIAAGAVDPILLERRRLPESFLTGFEDLDPAFRTWLAVQRQCLHDEIVRCLEDMIAARPPWSTRKRLGLALVNLDPTHELGCRTAMEASARLGDTAGALRLYKSLWDVLDEDFDSEPSEATQALVSDIKLGRIASVPTADPDEAAAMPVGNGEGTAAAPTNRSAGDRPAPPGPGLFLLVDAFDTSAVPEAARASFRVFRHELIASLVRFRDWAVLDLDGRLPVDIARPAFLVNATAVADGAGALRFVMTLKNVASGRFVWSERFPIETADWSRTQHGVIRRIAAALNVSMSTERLAQIAGRPDLSLDQFDRWLKGQELMLRWRPEDEAQAERLFRSIIAENPRFAPAHSGVAGILNSRHLIFPGTLRSRERHEEALGFARTAVEIDPVDTRTQLNLAWSHAMSGMPNKAAVNFLLACNLNPNDPWTLVSAALGLAYCGELGEAEGLSKLALDNGLGVSRLHWAYQAGVRFILGDFAGCIEAAERAENVVFYLGGWKSAAHAIVGSLGAARAEFDDFQTLVRANWFGAPEPGEDDVSRWLLQCFPIDRAPVLSKLREGLRLAGAVRPRPARTAPQPSSAAPSDRVVGNA